MFHGEVNNNLDDAKGICPTISCNIISRATQIYWSSLYCEDDKCRLASNENESESYDNSRQKGERPFRILISSNYKTNLRPVKVHNNTRMKYTLEKRYLPCGKILPTGCLEEIINRCNFLSMV